MINEVDICSPYHPTLEDVSISIQSQQYPGTRCYAKENVGPASLGGIAEMIRTLLLTALLLVAYSAKAGTEIHKCVDADGNIAYQQTPCPVEKKKTEVVELPEQIDEIEEEQPPQAPAINNQTHGEVEACKDPLRDAIDAIEAEMLRGFSPEQGEEFKEKLRTLTEEMRACG